jgi:glycosyltransferase involved in cell wall biosynthesis
MSQPARFQLLSVVFPMWNEQDYIDRALDAAGEVCRLLTDQRQIVDYELVVVDDASTDDTPALADAWAQRDAHVRVIHHPVNRKLGGSIKSGLAAARGDLVLYTDADLPFEMVELLRAVRVLRHYEADMVSAYRLDRTGEGARRAVYSFGYNALIAAMFGVRIRDVNFAFKLCRRSMLEQIDLVSEGSFIDAELVVRASRMGFHIVQIGVDYFPRTRGTSTLSSPAVIRAMLAEMRRLRGDLAAVGPVTGRRRVTRGGSSPATGGDGQVDG